ncbi:hypothetical protein ACHAWF_006851 [Thalassiosira exigua]
MPMPRPGKQKDEACVAIASERTLANVPRVHLFLAEAESDGHLVRGFASPKIRTAFAEPSQFQLVPLKEDGTVVEVKAPIRTRSQYLGLLRSGVWPCVAILCDNGKFLSCRRATTVPKKGKMAPTRYRSTISDNEMFSVEYHAGTGSFSFQSHNGLYLHANHKLWTAPCREAPSGVLGETVATKRSWCVSPLLGSSCEEERIEFVGVSRGSGGFKMSLKAEGGRIDESYMDPIKGMIMERLGYGECTHFCGSGNDLWHYFLRDNETEDLYMVVTTSRFSRVLAGECMDSLKCVHEKYFEDQDKTDERLRQNFLGREETMRKELQYFVWSFDEENDAQATMQLRPVVEQMEDNIASMLENIGNAEVMLESVQEIEEQSKLFKKRARNVRNRQVKKHMFYKAAMCGTALGGVGALVGWLIGGPAGTVFLGWQGAEIGVVAAAGVGVGALMGGGTSLPYMWKRYVHIADLPARRERPR